MMKRSSMIFHIFFPAVAVIAAVVVASASEPGVSALPPGGQTCTLHRLHYPQGE